MLRAIVVVAALCCVPSGEAVAQCSGGSCGLSVSRAAPRVVRVVRQRRALRPVRLVRNRQCRPLARLLGR